MTALLFSLAPACQVSTLNLTRCAERGREHRCVPAPTRQGLVVAEIALAFVLLVGAGLMTRTLVNLITIKTGFESDNVLTVPISMAGTTDVNPEQQAVFFSGLLEGYGRNQGSIAPGIPRTFR